MILSGIALSSTLTTSLINKCKLNKTLFGRPPSLHVIIVGEDPSSHVYVKMKAKRAAELGIDSRIHYFDSHTSQDAVLKKIQSLNKDQDVDGILIQLPLPVSFSKTEVLNSILPNKDVDGLTAHNLGLLLQNNPKHVPCTPLGCMQLIQLWKPDITGLNAVVIGRSNLVGSPLSTLLTQANATVTLCHSKTQNLKHITTQADILVVACGKPHMINHSYVKAGACIIDVGITKVNNVLMGDVDFDSVKQIAGAITPVPGGVGPMTVFNLLNNTQQAMDYNFKRTTF